MKNWIKRLICLIRGHEWEEYQLAGTKDKAVLSSYCKRCGTWKDEIL